MRWFRLLCVILGIGGAASMSVGWPGHEWDDWRAKTGTEKPVLETAQAGQPGLAPLLPADAAAPGIREWETKRDQILATLQTLMGEPTPFQKLPPYAEFLGEEDCGSYLRKHIRIASEPDDWIPAYYLVPKKLKQRPNPTMIVIHQTVPQGKKEPCGMEGSPDLDFAAELVERGFICIAPDMIGFGERIPPGTQPYHTAADFYVKHPKWSFFGKMVWDISRVVDWLETRPEVDIRRLGSIGHSHGAYSTIMGTAFEPRISAAVASCGFTTLRTDPDPNRWSHLTALLPRLGFFVEEIQNAPFDWHEVVATIAPRAYFNYATLADDIFPNTDNLKSVFEDVGRVYGLYGATDRLGTRLVPGPHSIPQQGREAAYAFLEQNLPARPGRSAEERLLTPSGDVDQKRFKRWEEFRGRIGTMLMHDIGPVDPPEWEPAFKVDQEEKEHGYKQQLISYEIPSGETIRAYLLIPDELGDPAPGMVVFHQTTEEGKREPAGLAGRPTLHFGPELARRDYVVLIPDSITAGERIAEGKAFETREYYRKFPNLSAMGKMIQDGRLALSLLASHPKVNADRIGVMGHSLGAEEALFVAAFDERVKASVASCGYAPFSVEANLDRWARDAWFSYMPRLRADLRAGWKPVWDFDDVIRLVAPRGYYNYQTSGDEIFPEAAAAHPLVESTRPVWALFGAFDHLQSRLEAGPHDMPDAARAEAYAWLDGLLKGE